MSAIVQYAPAAAAKRSPSPFRSLFRKLLSLRPRFARIDAQDLSPHLQRDLGLLDGRSTTRDF